MPTLVTAQGSLHYEVSGHGPPVILLHGWLGSWVLWRETIDILSQEFRTYALDFFGFGDSSNRNANFTVTDYVDLVHEFMDRLGIVQAPLVGHSMGGTVSLGVASRYPRYVSKVTVIGSPINGSSLNLLLKLSGNRSIAHLLYRFPFMLNSSIYLMTHAGSRKGDAIYRMVKADAAKVPTESFFQSIGTLHRTNLTAELRDLQMPVLGIYGQRDNVVSPNQLRLLVDCVPHAREAWFEESGHFPMVDEPDRFFQTLQMFLKE